MFTGAPGNMQLVVSLSSLLCLCTLSFCIPFPLTDFPFISPSHSHVLYFSLIISLLQSCSGRGLLKDVINQLMSRSALCYREQRSLYAVDQCIPSFKRHTFILILYLSLKLNTGLWSDCQMHKHVKCHWLLMHTIHAHWLCFMQVTPKNMSNNLHKMTLYIINQNQNVR